VFSSTYYSNGNYSLTVNHTAGSTAGFESEANNTLATADALNLGTAIRGQLSGFSDIDTFKFEASAAGVVTLVFDAPTDSAYSDYFTVRLTNASGSTISKITTGRDQTLKAAVAQAGTYFVQIESGDYYYNGGTYLLTASFAAGGSGFELEPNDDSANVISSGAQIRGQLSSDKDTDWFYLKTSSASDLVVAFDAPTNSSFSNYFQVWVFDDDGDLLASKATGQDTTFSVGAAEPGNYFVAVTTAQSNLYDAGQYGLTVTAQASTVLRESETNDTTATADPLALGTNIRGQLATAVDVDRFAVTMTSAGTLTVNFDGPTNSTWTNYFDVDVVGPTGTLLATRSTGGDIAFDVKVPASGIYTVVISTASSWAYDSGEYRLGVSAVLEDPIPAGAITGTPTVAQTETRYTIRGTGAVSGTATATLALTVAPAISDLDALRYVASHSDLINVFGTNIEKARQHYLEFGFNEGRKITEGDY
jgi:hypothetical protein